MRGGSQKIGRAGGQTVGHAVSQTVSQTVSHAVSGKASPKTSAKGSAAVTPTATTGEQVAKRLGQAILQGRYAPGERVGEQAVAEMFALSRGPVRDALRLLERQGLVQILPRRGAYVVELALNDVADIFNVRCALLRLAVRYLARNPDKSALTQVDPKLAQLRRLTLQDQPALADFVQAIGRVAIGLLQACANTALITAYRQLPHDALWQVMWVTNQPLGYQRPTRRLDSLHDYEQLLLAVRAGRPAPADGAERLMRKIMTDSRDEVLREMAASHSDAVEPFRQQVYA